MSAASRQILPRSSASFLCLLKVEQIGKAPTADTVKRFIVEPVGYEITGACETPDGKALFTNIPHPVEDTVMADVTNAAKYQSQWQANAGYDPGKRPRSATLVITKSDGGRIGT